MQFTKDTNIGEVIKVPEATKVIERFFGRGCFTCPGIRMESLGFGAMMHSVDVNVLLKELNALSGAVGKGS